MNEDEGPRPRSDRAASDGARRRDRPNRIVAVDWLRGAALAGMVAYHALWDLHAFGLTGLDPSADTPLHWLGHAVAAAFLLLSGLSLWLAEREGRSWRHAWARIAVLALAAGGVTLVTWAVLPDAAVRFGILHCLAVTNAVAWFLRRCPTGLLLAMAAVCFAVPSLWPWPLSPGWAWSGLSANVPPTLDFRPVLPWQGCVLLGLAAGRTGIVPWLAHVRLRNTVASVAAAAGRHSLMIYLVHQPVMVGAVAAFGLTADVTASPPVLSTPAEAAAFLGECDRTCRVSGGADDMCRSTCHCVLTATLASKRHPTLIERLRPPQAGVSHALEVCREDVPAAP